MIGILSIYILYAKNVKNQEKSSQLGYVPIQNI